FSLRTMATTARGRTREVIWLSEPPSTGIFIPCTSVIITMSNIMDNAISTPPPWWRNRGRKAGHSNALAHQLEFNGYCDGSRRKLSLRKPLPWQYLPTGLGGHNSLDLCLPLRMLYPHFCAKSLQYSHACCQESKV